MAFMQARCYTNAPIQHLLLCALDRPLLMSPTCGCRCTARRKLSRERFGHLCILTQRRTTHLAKPAHSALMDGWVYSGKRHFWGTSGLPRQTWKQSAGQGNREAVKLSKQSDTHVLVTHTACVLFI